MPGAAAGRAVVGLVDYQAGNLQSIGNAFEHLGARAVRVHDESEMGQCTHLVLPGVGAFGFCAERLAASGMTAAISQWAFAERRPLLGICVGMQLLADGSEESPAVPGLGWVGGQVRRLLPEAHVLRVPHVGWNTVRFDASFGEYRSGMEADFYFDHSFAYHGPRNGETVAKCEHGVAFSAVVRKENLVAVQFHPEKSQAAGMRFLRGFLAL